MRAAHRTLLAAGLLQLAGAAGVHLAHRPPDWSSPERAPSFRSDAVSEHGWLSVRGPELVDEDGRPVTLRGVSLHGTQWFPPKPGWTVPSMVRMFGLSAVRVPAYVHAYSPRKSGEYWGGYLADPERITRRVQEVVDDAIAAGVYVLIDWHTQSDPGEHVEQAAAFFARMAARYGRYPNVIYEIANEPAGVGWPQIARYAERIIPVIRAEAPESVIVVGTPAFSKDTLAPLGAPLPYEDLLYALHFYAGGHSLDEVRSRTTYVRNAGLPLFVSEWAPSDVMMQVTDYEAAADWVDYLEAQGISWVAWSLGNKAEPASLLRPEAPLSGPWTVDDLSETGRWLLPRLRGPLPIAARLTSPGDAPVRSPPPEALFGVIGEGAAAPPEGVARIPFLPDARSDWSLLKSPGRLRRALRGRGGGWLPEWGLIGTGRTSPAVRALWAAEVLGVLAEAGVAGASYRPSGPEDRRAHRLAAQALRGALYPCASTQPALRCFLSRDSEGQIRLLALNTSPSEATLTLDIPGLDGALTARRPGGEVAAIAPGVDPVLPPRSLAVFTAPSG